MAAKALILQYNVGSWCCYCGWINNLPIGVINIKLLAPGLLTQEEPFQFIILSCQSRTFKIETNNSQAFMKKQVP